MKRVLVAAGRLLSILLLVIAVRTVGYMIRFYRQVIVHGAEGSFGAGAAGASGAR